MADQKLRYKVTANTKQFTSAMKAVGVLVVAVLAAAVKITAEFNKELSKLRGISGATGNELRKMESQARQLGATTAFTATQVLQLQVELAKLGFTTDEILNSSGGVLDLAAGLGVDLKDAAALTGTTLRAFGLDTNKTRKLVDVLATSATSSALDFDKLKESLKLVAPVAAQLGYSLEETVAILAAMADAGIAGSQAGTGLRQILLELEKKGLTLNEAFMLVNGSANQVQTALDLVKKRALPAFLVLKDGADKTAALTTAFENSEGAASKLRTELENNLWGDWKKLISVTSDAALTLGKSIDGPLRKAVQGLTKWVGEGGLLRGLDNVYKAFLYAGIGVLEFGKALDWVAYAISRGPFGIGIGDSDILLRIVKADTALKEFRKNLKLLKDGKIGFEATGGGGGKKDDKPKGTKIDLEEVIVGAPELTEFELFIRRFQALAIGLDEFLINWIENGAQSLLVDSFSAIGEAIGNGDNILKAAGNAILDTIGQFIQKLGTEAVRLGVLAVGFAKAVALIKAWIIANPVLAIAGGLALIAVGAAFSASANKSAGNISGGGGGGSPGARSSISVDTTGTNGGGTVVFKIGNNELIGQLQQATDRRGTTHGTSRPIGI